MRRRRSLEARGGGKNVMDTLFWYLFSFLLNIDDDVILRLLFFVVDCSSDFLGY